MPYPNESFSQVFSSQMIEHIPVLQIERTLVEINRVMRPGGVLRIVTPDLFLIAKAYVENDVPLMEKMLREDLPDRDVSLGWGSFLVGYIVNPGLDNIILSHDFSEVVGSFGHIFIYDRTMLERLLIHYGFVIDRDHCNYESSAISDYKSLRTVAYDVERATSMVVECHKDHHVQFDPDHTRISVVPYNYRMVVPDHWLLRLNFRMLGILYSLKFPRRGGTK